MILFALSAVVLVGFAGLALDAGLSYLGQTGLQSASDNASLAAARMLATDYTAQNQSPAPTSLPWSYSQIVAAVNSDIAGNTAGSTQTTTYRAYFTDSSGNRLCQFWPTATATCGGAIPESSGFVSAAGAEVISTNTHSTNVLGLLGIHTASETAPATAIFGPIEGGGTGPFAVFYACYDNNPSALIQLKETVTYFQTSGYVTSCDSTTVDQSFKGDLKPGTFVIANNTAPGWASAGAGIGKLKGIDIQKGQTILVPLIDCLKKHSWCTEPSGMDACGSTANQSLVTPVSGGWDMCVTGLIAIRANATCDGPSSSPCQGTVVPFFQGQGGVLVCPSSEAPSCGGESQTQGTTAIGIELLH